MRLGVVGAIAIKEIRDTLRDRRAVFVSMVLPMLLYPVMIVGFVNVSLALKSKLSKEKLTVWVENLDELPDGLRGLFEASDFQLELSEVPADAPREDEALAKAFTEGDLELWMTMPTGFKAGLDGDGQARIALVYQKASERSRIAYEEVESALLAYGGSLREVRLERRGIGPEVYRPIVVEGRNLGARDIELMRSLSMMLIILGVTGAFYPALDLGAGEKERGTLETLLLTPARRGEIAAGKYLAVFAVGLTAGLLNVASLGLTFLNLGALIPEGATKLPLQVPVDGTTMLAIAAVLTPLVALFSAVALAVSTYAASYKEGQTYLTPVMLGVMVPAMGAALPGLDLSPDLCIVPVLGTSLLFRDLLSGQASGWQVGLVFASSLFYAALAIRFVASLYGREQVLMRPAAAGAPLLPGLARLMRKRAPEPTGDEPGSARAEEWSDLPGHLQPPPAVPGAVHALVAFALAVSATWFIGMRLREASLAWASLATVAAIFGLASTLFPLAAGLDYKASLRLRWPSWRLWPAALGAGCASFGLGVLLTPATDIKGAMADEQAMTAAFKALEELQALGPWGFALLLGALPAVGEELLLRGFIQTGLGRDFGWWLGWFAAAVLGALLNFAPSQFALLVSSGLAAGLLVRVGGSVWPAALAAAIGRGLFLLVQQADERGEALLPALASTKMTEAGVGIELAGGGWAVMVLGALLAAGFAIWELRGGASSQKSV